MKSARLRTSRRKFLRQLALTGTAAGASLLTPEWLSGFPSPQSGRRPRQRRVLVLGAGLAGLAAAWELREAGHEVTVLEGRMRPGGRVYTLRQPFAGDLYAEAGAVAFSSTYTQANRFIDALELKRADWLFVGPGLRPLYHLKGRRFSLAPGQPADWPYPLSAEERSLGPMGIVERYVFKTLPVAISDPQAWKKLAHLDTMTFGEYLRSQGASPGAVELIRDTQWFGPSVEHGSALSSAMSDFGLFMAGKPFVLKGGNDQLPQAMAQRLTRQIHYGVRVQGIRELKDGVEVVARRGNKEETHSADQVICTLPASVVRHLRIEPSLPDAQRAAIANLPYLNTTRTYLQVSAGFWFEEGVTAAAMTDLPIDDIGRHPADRAGGRNQRAILESFVDGPAAARWTGLSDQEIIERTLREMEKVHPRIRDHFEGGYVKAWAQDPFALGCVSYPAPGDVTRYLELLQRPRGRIHFAGEHTTILRSSMEGALRSGIRAAEEVMVS